MKKIVVAYRRHRSFRYHSKHAYPAGREKVCNRLRWAGLIKGFDLYGYRRGVREIVCSRLRRRKFYGKFGLHAYPAGAYFCAYKSRQNTLGALPQDPCRWLCWIRIDF